MAPPQPARGATAGTAARQEPLRSGRKTSETARRNRASRRDGRVYRLVQRARQGYRLAAREGSMRRLLFFAALLGLLAASIQVTQMQAPNPAHFHHVHLNSTDPQKTFEFYEQDFGAKRVKFRDRSDALFTGRGF